MSDSDSSDDGVTVSSNKVPIESSDDSSSSEEEQEEDHKDQEESGPRNEMADYSIGDRVEVKWQAELFDAAVIHVHSPGKVDVVYDTDGSMGTLGDEEKKGEDVRWLPHQGASAGVAPNTAAD